MLFFYSENKDLFSEFLICFLIYSLFLMHGPLYSTPESLGRVWKVHLWHDNGGLSPSWYLSHVVVRDLVQGSCWFFLGQCWLAVDEGDGKVERSLTAAEYSLTFKQVYHNVLCLLRIVC